MGGGRAQYRHYRKRGMHAARAASREVHLVVGSGAPPPRNHSIEVRTRGGAAHKRSARHVTSEAPRFVVLATPTYAQARATYPRTQTLLLSLDEVGAGCGRPVQSRTCCGGAPARASPRSRLPRARNTLALPAHRPNLRTSALGARPTRAGTSPWLGRKSTRSSGRRGRTPLSLLPPLTRARC